MTKTVKAVDGVDCERFRRQMTGGVPLPSRTESCKLVSAASPRLAVVLLLLLFVVMTTGQMMNNEQECLSQGGICAVKESCPMESRGAALCQQENSVCCHAVPDNVSSCHAHGGNCKTTTGCENVQDFGTLDCEEGQRCCLLIY